MAQKGVLGDAEAHAGGRRIALADLEIDIGHGRIEGGGIGVAHLVGIGQGRGHRDRHGADLILIAAGEDDHGDDAFVEARRTVGEHQHRTRSANAVEPHRQRNQQAVADAVTARRQPDDAAGRRLAGLVEGGLDGGGVVGLAVADGLDSDSGSVGRLGGVDGGAGPSR